MTTNLNVALLPLHIYWNDKKRNLSLLKELIPRLHPETELVILPETFSTGFPSNKNSEEILELAENSNSETISILQSLAKQYQIAICGTIIINDNGLIKNRLFFIEPTEETTYADKRHLFSMAGEDSIFTPGKSRLNVRYRGWNISAIVCYDVRFPVWCRNKNNEYDILIAVANWPDVRISAWNTLLKARAIENLSYVCGVNCLGTDHLGFNYDGSSEIIDFKGFNISTERIIDRGNEFHQKVIYAKLSKEKLENFRTKFPAWKDSDKFSLL